MTRTLCITFRLYYVLDLEGKRNPCIRNDELLRRFIQQDRG